MFGFLWTDTGNTGLLILLASLSTQHSCNRAKRAATSLSLVNALKFLMALIFFIAINCLM